MTTDTTTDTDPQPGDAVVTTAGPLGVIRDETSGPFCGRIAKGTAGALRGPHPNPALAGWLLVEVPASAVDDAEPGLPETVLLAARPSHIAKGYA
jgi:hypothetical protein